MAKLDTSWTDDPRARWQIKILLTMYVGYAAFMLCRNTLGAASPAMIADPALGMNKESFGHLMSWHSAGAIAGKLITGIGADLLGGRRMFLIALSLTALANVGFAMSTSFTSMGIFNFLGQAFKAGGWPAMVKIVGQWYPLRRSGQVWSIISTSSRVGTVAAGLLLGFLLSQISWRAVFVVSAVITGFVVVLAFFFLKERPTDVGLEPLPPETPNTDQATGTEAAPHAMDGVTVAQACWKFAASLRFWMICLSICFLTILMDFINFIPIYLNEVLQISPDKASMSGSAFPAGMFVALVGTSLVYDRLNKKRLIFVLGGLLAVSCLCVVALWNFDRLPISDSMKVPTSIGLIFVMGFSLSPAYYIPMSIFAVAFGGQHAGFLVALIDVFGYAGALAFNFFGGSIAENYGWRVFLFGLLSIAIAAMLSMTTFLFLDYRAKVKATDSPTS
ncbi:MAG: MFS transporter [Pirellulaceae bacterium]|nr:MFS transporter [Pirellulaceae bacterium]